MTGLHKTCRNQNPQLQKRYIQRVNQGNLTKIKTTLTSITKSPHPICLQARTQYRPLHTSHICSLHTHTHTHLSTNSLEGDIPTHPNSDTFNCPKHVTGPKIKSSLTGFELQVNLAINQLTSIQH